MGVHGWHVRWTLVLCLSVSAVVFTSTEGRAQSGLKKVRMGIAATSIGFLPIYAAHHRGFYKDEGIDLEIILMSLAAANNAFFKGEIDYSAGLTGLALAAMRNYPAKILIFTVAKPLQFFVSRKEIKEPRDLRGKKVAGSSPGGTATVLAKQALSHYGIDPEKDAAVLPMGGSTASRFAAMESGVVDATMLPVPAVIFAKAKGFNELAFMGDIAQFPQNGFGATEKKIRENPDEIYRMVRASLRGLLFMSDPKNREEVVQIVMKQHKVSDRKLAEQMLAYSQRVVTKEARVSNEEVQYLIDLMRATAKVTRPVTVDQVVDFSFLEKARKDLGLIR